MRSRYAARGIHRGKNCGADVDANAERIIWRVLDVFGSAAVDEGATGSSRGSRNKGK